MKTRYGSTAGSRRLVALGGSPQGVAVYVNGNRFNTSFGDTVQWDLIPDIAVDRNGMVWFANEDIFAWDPVQEKLVDWSPVALFRSNTVEADSNGTVWFLSTSGDLYRFNTMGNSFERIHRGGGDRFSRPDIASGP